MKKIITILLFALLSICSSCDDENDKRPYSMSGEPPVNITITSLQSPEDIDNDDERNLEFEYSGLYPDENVWITVYIHTLTNNWDHGVIQLQTGNISIIHELGVISNVVMDFENSNTQAYIELVIESDVAINGRMIWRIYSDGYYY